MLKRVCITFFTIIIFLTSCASTDASKSWQYKSDTDAFNDHTRTVSYMFNESVNMAGQPVYLKVEIGCGGEGAFIGLTYSEKTKEAIYRIDKETPVSIDNFLNFDGVYMSTIVGSKGQKFIDSILAGNKLIIRRKNLSALTQSDHEVSISSEKRVIKKALSTCS